MKPSNTITLVLLFLFLLNFQNAYSQCDDMGPCNICSVTATVSNPVGATIDVGTSAIPGIIDGGTITVGPQLVISATECGEISFDIDLSFLWEQGISVSWIHGVSFGSSGGWSGGQGIPPANPGWLFLNNGLTGLCTGNTYGAGYFYDPPGIDCWDNGNNSAWTGTNCGIDIQSSEGPPPSPCAGPADDGIPVDADPSDNFGVNCTDCDDFGFTLTYCPSSAGTVVETIIFNITEDGESGGWGVTSNCNYQIEIPIVINNAGISITPPTTIDCGDCIDLTAGANCDNYIWTNLTTGQVIGNTSDITVCPEVTTSYQVDVSGTCGNFTETTTITVNECPCEPEAGVISATTGCPNEIVTITNTGYNSDPEYAQEILIIDASGTIIEVTTGDQFVPLECGDYTIAAYNYLLPSEGGSASPGVTLIGTSIFDLISFCGSNPDVTCCDVELTTITVGPDTPVSIVCPPPVNLPACTSEADIIDAYNNWLSGFSFSGGCNPTDNLPTAPPLPPYDCGTDFSLTMDYEVIDDCSTPAAAATCSTTFTVSGIAGLTIPPNDNTTVTCPSDAVDPGPPATVQDECGNDVIPIFISTTSNPDPITCEGEIIWTYQYESCDGTTYDWTYTYTITGDNNLPIPANGNETVLCPTDAVDPGAPPTIQDECGNDIIPTFVSTTSTPDPIVCDGTVEWVYEYEACDGTTFPWIYTFTITGDPSITLPPNGSETVVCPTDAVDPGAPPTIQDACGNDVVPVFVGSTTIPDPIICDGEYTWTYEYETCDGSTYQWQYIYTVTGDPSFTLPPAGSETVTCPTDAVDPGPPPTVQDGCGNDIVPVFIGSTTDPDPIVCEGEYTWTYQYEACDGSTQDWVYTYTVTGDPNLSIPANVTENTMCVVDAEDPGPPPTIQDACGNDIVPTFVGSETTPDPIICEGTVIWTYEYEACDGSIYPWTYTYVVDGTNPPTFDNAPTSIPDVSCSDPLPTQEDLTATSTCGDDVPVVMSVDPYTPDICSPVTVTYRWIATDDCGEMAEVTQTFNILPIEPPEIINPPADITIFCDEDMPPLDPLDYSNGETGNCEDSGELPGTQNGTLSACGSVITYEWNGVDLCGNQLNHTQTITIEPAPEPELVNPPGDVTINCGDPLPPLDPLDYTNGESDICEIMGSIDGTQNGALDPCGSVVTYNWNGTDECGNSLSHTQQITVLPADPPSWDNSPADITIDCGDPIPTPGDQTFSNGLAGQCEISGSVEGLEVSNNVTPCDGGQIVFEWQGLDECGEALPPLTQTININPAPPANLINLPVDVTISCDDELPPLNPLYYTNGLSQPCLIEGQINGVTNGELDPCGTTIVYEWNGTDDCGNPLSHTQNITILPASPPVFVNPPQDANIECGDPLPPIPDLEYTNGETGSCEISGFVPGIEIEIDDYTTQITWTYTNECTGEELVHTIIITETVGPDIVVINPDPICSGESFDLNTLSITDNNSTGAVITFHSAFPPSGANELPTTVVSPTVTTTYYVMATAGQCTDVEPVTLVVNPTPDLILLENPVICIGDSYDLSTLPIADGANSGAIITYHSSSPPSPVNELPSTIVMPTETTTYYIFADANGCTDELAVTLEVLPGANAGEDNSVIICEGDEQEIDLTSLLSPDVDPGIWTEITNSGQFNDQSGILIVDGIEPGVYTFIYTVAGSAGCPSDEAFITIEIVEEPDAGEDGFTTVCNEGLSGSSVDLPSHIGGTPQFGGTWTDVDGSGVDLTNVFNVDFSGVAEGVYQFQYEVAGTPPCGNASAIVTVTVEAPPSYTILSVECLDLTIYEIVFETDADNIETNIGTLNDLGNGQYEVTNIPIDETVFLLFSFQNNDCEVDAVINPPNCDCPPVAPPVGTNEEICFGEPTPTLVVTVDQDLSVNWYGQAVGGNILPNGDNTLEFTPDDTEVGVYEYFAESYLLSDPTCVSSVRTKVTLTIHSNPTGNDISLSFCDDDADGITSIFIEDSDFDMINSNSNIEFEIYETLDDLENGVNELSNPFDNTTPFNQQVIVKVINTNTGCSTVAIIDLTIVPAIVVEIEISDESCTNLEDGEITIDASGGSGNFEYSLDGNTFQTSNIFTDLASGDYTAYVQDEFGCLSEMDFSIEPGIELNVISIDFECNDNMTGDDGSDDYYTVTLVVDANFPNASNSYEVTWDGNIFGPFTYGETVTFELPATGNIEVLEISDVDEPQCFITQNTIQLDPCSDDCNLSITQSTYTCNDNGTGTDATDDYYTVVVNATVVNGGPTNKFVVLADGVEMGTYTYGLGGSFELPADGSMVTLEYHDVDDPSCNEIIEIGELDPCSSDCEIEILSITSECFDNGTPTDPTDDYYEVCVDATATNPGLSLQFTITINSEVIATYNYNEGGCFELPASNTIQNILFKDADDNACQNSEEIGPLVSCSTNCILDVTELELECFDNGTPSDGSDDYYEISFDASIENGNSSVEFYVIYDGNTEGPFIYGIGGTITVPATGDVLTIVFEDVLSGDCSESVDTAPLNPCSNDCEVFLVDLLIGDCDNNNTGNTADDDTYSISFTFDGLNIGDTYDISDGTNIWGPFNYNEENQIDGLPANGEIILLTMTDEFGICMTTFEVSQEPCSECSVEVEITGNDILDCFTQTIKLVAESASQVEYEWTGPPGIGGNEETLFVSEVGTYCVMVTDDQNCTSESCVDVVADPDVPVADAGDDQMLSCLINEVELGGSNSTSGPDITYVWTNEDGEVVSNEQYFTTTEPGIYYFQVVDGNCKSPLSSVIVDENITSPFADIDYEPDSLLNCIVVTITLSAEDQENVVYEWTTEENTFYGNSITITETGYVILYAVDTLSGCEATDTIYIDEAIEYPFVGVDEPEPLTCLIDEVTISATSSQSGDNIIHQWYYEGEAIPGANDTWITTNKPGEYMFESIDTLTGCSNDDVVIVEDISEYPLAEAGEDQFLPCDEISAILDGSLSEQGSQIQYNWYTNDGSIISGENSISPSVEGVGYYYIEVLNEENNCIAIDSVLLLNPEGPAIDAVDYYDPMCFNETDGSISVEGVGGTEPYMYTINGSDPTEESTFYDLGSGAYTVEVIDAFGCKSDSVIILDNPPQFYIDIEGEITIELGDETTLVGDVNIPFNDILSIQWTPSETLSCDTCLVTIANPVKTTTYTLTITDIYGCEASFSITIRVDNDANVHVPNIFSPNDDGYNDMITVFADKGVDKVNRFLIFDRWGNLVFKNENFKANDLESGWDGSFNGQKVNNAVFVFLAEVQLLDGSTTLLDGTITVAR